MKVRLGFVSNSSSSSFTCEICNRTESGWDASVDECGMVQCENGHVFCDDEKLDIDQEDIEKDVLRFVKQTLKDNIKSYKDKTEDWEVQAYNDYSEQLERIKNDEISEDDLDLGNWDCGCTQIECPICNFEEPSYPDLKAYLQKITKQSEDEVFAEVKKVNKRRKVLRDHEYVEFVLRGQNKTVDQLLSEMKETYKDYKSFMKARK